MGVVIIYQSKMVIFNNIAKLYNSFEDWFNQKFAWFFTNGMKEIRNYNE